MSYDGLICTRHTLRSSFSHVGSAGNIAVGVGVVAKKVGRFIRRIHHGATDNFLEMVLKEEVGGS